MNKAEQFLEEKLQNWETFPKCDVINLMYQFSELQNDSNDKHIESLKQMGDILSSTNEKLEAYCRNHEAENIRLRSALLEIAEGKGRYSQDQFTHTRNTIEDMKELANEALNK